MAKIAKARPAWNGRIFELDEDGRDQGDSTTTAAARRDGLVKVKAPLWCFRRHLPSSASTAPLPHPLRYKIPQGRKAAPDHVTDPSADKARDPRADGWTTGRGVEGGHQL